MSERVVRRKRRAHDEWATEGDAFAARTTACECAAKVVAARPELQPIPHLFSLCVFFESYIAQGSLMTKEPFGPKEPAPLRVVERKPAA